MRLIDADYITEGRVSNDPVVIAAKCAPTIDAIPVEWLENRLNTLCFEAMGAGALYGDRIGELAKSINEVMKLWQKEQEAQKLGIEPKEDA